MKKTVIIPFLFLLSFPLFSQTKQIETLQRQRELLQEEIQNTNKLFLDVKKHTTTLLQRINLINKRLTTRRELITVYQNEIVALEKEQKQLEKEIAKLNDELEKKQKNYAKAIKGMLNNQRAENKLIYILSGKTLGESLRRMQYLKDYSKWQKKQAEEIKKKQAELAEKKSELAKAKADKQNALLALQNEQNKLINEEKMRQTEMAEAKSKQRELQKTLQTKRQQAAKLNARIEQLIAEEVARQEREAEARRRAEEAEKQRVLEAKKTEEKRKKPEQIAKNSKAKSEEGKTTSQEKHEELKSPTQKSHTEEAHLASAETFNLSKNFAANKGQLPMPVTGISTIVSNFGINRSSEWNVSINSNGIDIQAQQGAVIRSVFEGEVSKVFSFPGSNTCMIVRHGDYYTFYANIIDPYVKQGDKVKTGQALGKIYTDPDTGISTMHFQLWQKTNKLDPQPWLRH
ncbi:murein hydrolase activator EnvC family protein [Anaerorudis cellulosivorans]|uniref:murein hydrolase activator EnvC family protein n=1 Tax=Anaerorudis cellulosivorans TaxID=3397862 RepID=UPI00221EB9BA|nr:peptidoglycan DD-metalloendopeptidase family protein [Seramator thermalis]MCW1735943.1 peptidoglycan DD-metalloendopeptidase family protein [Seramator thermalis]